MDAQQIEEACQRALAQLGECQDLDALAELHKSLLGKGGMVLQAMATIPTLPKEQRPVLGKSINLFKRQFEADFEARKRQLQEAALARQLQENPFDATLPPPAVERGSLHPITQVTREIEDVFLSMGYQIADGPEIESDWNNFEALNIPADHPARDSQDTFYLAGEGQWVLRTHTSPVQVRAMKSQKPPFRMIAPGKVFRHEATDASHDHTFHQLEGLVVDKNVSVAHLINSMKTLLRGIFGRELEIRLRPGFFPFVEPGFELDARCPFCDEGCSVCKKTRWIELLPCGLVHPNVLRACGLDPEQWSGFAFGLGLSRLVMLRFGITDVRHLLGSDLRFLEQF